MSYPIEIEADTPSSPGATTRRPGIALRRGAAVAAALAALIVGVVTACAPANALDPAPGGFATWHRVAASTPGGGASVLTTDSAGRVIYADSAARQIARVDPVSGKTDTFDLGPTAVDVVSLVEGPDGNLWFGDDARNAIGRVDVRTGGVSYFLISGRFASAPKSIVAGTSSLWFGDGMGRGLFEIELDGTMHLVPEPSGHDLAQLTKTTDGRIWYTIQASRSVGSYAPASGTFELHPIPAATAEISEIEVTSRGDIWVGWNQGIAKLNSAGHVLLSKAYTATKPVTPGSMVPGASAEMYFTDGEGGLGFVDAAGNTTLFAAPFADQYSSTITVDSYGSLWTNAPGGYLAWN